MSCIHNDLQLFADVVVRGRDFVFKALVRCAACGTPFEFPRPGGGQSVELSMVVRPARDIGVGRSQPRVTKHGPQDALTATLRADEPELRPAGLSPPDLDDDDFDDRPEPGFGDDGQ